MIKIFVVVGTLFFLPRNAPSKSKWCKQKTKYWQKMLSSKKFATTRFFRMFFFLQTKWHHIEVIAKLPVCVSL